MVSNHFDSILKIAAFRGIAGSLLENGLITQVEYDKINRRLESKENQLLMGQNLQEVHSRKICEEDQAQNGLDSSAEQSDD